MCGASAGLWLSRWQLPRAGSPIWSLLLAAWVIGNAHLARTGAPRLAGWESRYGVALGDEFGVLGWLLGVLVLQRPRVQALTD